MIYEEKEMKMTDKVINWYDGKTREDLIEYCEALMLECDDLRSQLTGDYIPLYADIDYEKEYAAEEDGSGEE